MLSENSADSRCGDCGPIIGSTVLEKDWKDRTPPKKQIDLKPLTTISPRAQTSTVYRMETDLSVSGNGLRNEPHHKVKSDTRHSTDSPIELEKAEEINKSNKKVQEAPEATLPSTLVTLEPTELPTTTMSYTTSESKTSTESLPTKAPSTTDPPTTMLPVETTSLKTEPELQTQTVQIQELTRKMLGEEIEKSVENLEKAIQESVNSQNGEGVMNSTVVDQIDRELEQRLEEAAKQLQDSVSLSVLTFPSPFFCPVDESRGKFE